jgi:hypothetical protein
MGLVQVQVQVQVLVLPLAEGGLDGWAVLDNFYVGVIHEGCGYPDCNRDNAWDLFDFLCFTNRFNDGDDYADCDGSDAFDFFDFLCYQSARSTGIAEPDEPWDDPPCCGLPQGMKKGRAGSPPPGVFER